MAGSRCRHSNASASKLLESSTHSIKPDADMFAPEGDYAAEVVLTLEPARPGLSSAAVSLQVPLHRATRDMQLSPCAGRNLPRAQTFSC